MGSSDASPGTKRDDADVDPVTLEVLWSRLNRIPQEMGVRLRRTAFSEIIKYADDFSTALFSWDGRLVSQGVFEPGFVGMMAFAMEEILDEHVGPDEWEQGDLLVMNDPYIGAGHLPDLLTFEPIFYSEDVGAAVPDEGGELVGFCVTVANLIDVGGSGPGSTAVYNEDMYEEGLQVPPVKLYEGGQLNESLYATLLENTREREKVDGDVQAQRGASNVGANLYRELVNEYGFETVKRYVDEIIDRSERRMRESLSEIPDGTYSFEMQVDAVDEPLPIWVELTADGDEVHVDFEGTAPQQPRYSINAVWNVTYAEVLYALMAAVDPGTQQTAGTIKPITMDAPEGSLVNVQPPAPVATRALIVNHVVSTINGALHQAIPDRIPACGSQGQWKLMNFTDQDTGVQQILMDGVFSGAGARPTRDGFPAVSGVTNLRNTPIEAIETSFPIRIRRYELVPDTEGAGRFHGGHGTVREHEFLAAADIQLEHEYFEVPPFGLAGGHNGAPGRCVVKPKDDESRDLNSKERLFVEAGTVMETYTPGGGGYGDPTERNPEAVSEDVRAGLVSTERAREIYGYDTGREE